jgi:hypothetical protein
VRKALFGGGELGHLHTSPGPFSVSARSSVFLTFVKLPRAAPEVDTQAALSAGRGSPLTLPFGRGGLPVSQKSRPGVSGAQADLLARESFEKCLTEQSVDALRKSEKREPHLLRGTER